MVLRLVDGGQVLGGAALRAPASVFQRLTRAGDRAILGVRPEAIALGSAASPDAVPAVIDLVEPMGSVNNVVLRLDGVETATADGDPLIAVVTSNESFIARRRTWLTLRPGRLVLFAVGQRGLRFACSAPTSARLAIRSTDLIQPRAACR